MEIYDGMLLTDVEADTLPAWLDDDNCVLELITSTDVPIPDYEPEHIWRLHLK